MPNKMVIDISKVSQIIQLGELTTGKSGNLSWRVSKNSYYITVSGQDLRFLNKNSFVKKALADKEKGNASMEWQIHSFLYKLSLSTGAVFHFQAPFISAISIMDKPPINQLKKLLPEVATYIKKISLVGYFPPGSKELALEVLKKAKLGADAIILKHHGALVTGPSLSEAINRAEALEFAAKVLLIGT